MTGRKPTPLEYLLTPEQAEAFGNYLDVRIQSIDSQLGEFREKRKRYELQMEDNFTWRAGDGRQETLKSSNFDDFGETIFDRQNDSLNIVGGFASFMVARTVDDIWGTDPYYQIFPEGLADHITADSIQKHSEWKLRMSNFKATGLQAVESTIGLGESIIKQVWKRDVDVFEERRNILVYADGSQVLCSDGTNVYGPDENGPGDEVIQIAGPDPETGEATMLLQVTKDPMGLVLNASAVTWNEMEVERQNVSYDNVKANLVHYGDILVPITAESFEDADFVGQKCQMRLSELIALYDLDEDLIAQLETDTYEQKTEASTARDTLGETAESMPHLDRPDPMIKLVEGWVRYDPVGDRRIRRIYALYAFDHKKLIKLDYIANVTPKGELPFKVIRAFSVKNRWYGRGYFEIYEKAQEFIDRHLNYVAYRNRFHANPVVFLDPSALQSEAESRDFELVPGQTHWLKNGAKAEDAMKLLELPDLDERTWQLMQMMIQVIQVRSGVTSAAQGETSSLPSTATATGIESILQSASTLARQPMNLMKTGLEAALMYAVKLIYANQNRDETFTYLEGDQAMTQSLLLISVKDIEMNVRLLLTRFRQRESLEAAKGAIDIMQTYVMLPELEKQSQRPLYVQAIKGHGFDQADQIVRQPIQMPVDPMTGQPMPVNPVPQDSGPPAKAA